MAGCKMIESNMNFCWDDKTFDTAMMMFPDILSYGWYLENKAVQNVERMRQADNWAGMDDVCVDGRDMFEACSGVPDLLKGICNVTWSAYNIPRIENPSVVLSEQEEIYSALSSMGADKFTCVQGYEFGALYPLAKYMSEKGAFGRELQPPDAAQNPEFDKQIEDKSAQLSAKEGELAQKEALLNETNNAELKQYVQNDIDVLNTDISTLRDELADLKSKAAPAIDEDNALAIVAQSIREYFTTQFATDNEEINSPENGFSMGAMVLIRGFAPYNRPAIGGEEEPQWLTSDVFDKAIGKAVADGAINEHEGKLLRAFKRINNGMTALERAKAAKTKPEAASWVAFAQSSMKEAGGFFRQVNPDMLGAAMRQVYTEFKTMPLRMASNMDLADAGDAKGATASVAERKDKEKDKVKDKAKGKAKDKDKGKDKGKGKGKTSFDCDTKPQVYLFWPKEKKDAFKEKCRK